MTFYKDQRDLIYSVRDVPVTECVAGNMLGKDFTSAFIALWFFCSRPRAKVLTTSVDQQQLQSVLWGEIRRFIQTAEIKLPIVENHLHLRKILNKVVDGQSYMIGRVAAKGEGMLGHHLDPLRLDPALGEIPTTLFIADEASGVEDDVWDKTDTWAHRKLAIGNPFPCSNFFYRDWKAGNVWNEDESAMLRHVMTIRGEDSPNVQRGLKQKAEGKSPDNSRVIPGVLGYADYAMRRRLWDPVMQCIGLDAKFWEGSESLLYPPQWLNRSSTYAAELSIQKVPRRARAIGIDPAEGGDKTTMAAVDEYGLIEMVSRKTPDTSVITKEALAFMYKHGCTADCVMFDAGGGGKQHADRLRDQGHMVRTVAFGGAATPKLIFTQRTIDEREGDSERRYIYKNRRAEMYGILRRLVDPSDEILPGYSSFGIPESQTELRRQLSLMPLMYDNEGCLMMLSKGKTRLGDKLREPRKATKTLTEIIGHSPDESDALVIATFCMMENKMDRSRSVGVAF